MVQAVLNQMSAPPTGQPSLVSVPPAVPTPPPVDPGHVAHHLPVVAQITLNKDPAQTPVAPLTQRLILPVPRAQPAASQLAPQLRLSRLLSVNAATVSVRVGDNHALKTLQIVLSTVVPRPQ